MFIDTYFTFIEEQIANCPYVDKWDVEKDKRSLYVGYLGGRIKFIDETFLEFIEFVDVQKGIEKYKYSYHYQTEKGRSIFRYDMAPHHKELSTFPHHKHIWTKSQGEKIIKSKIINLPEVLEEVGEKILESEKR